MKILHAPLRQCAQLVLWCGAALVLALLTTDAAAQSTNIEFPTPVRTNEISGTIAPRDVGDPRLTRYYYSLSGTNGDLIITVESRNLNGDVDLFTAGALRPLVKLSMYAAGSGASTTSKTIYFKREEALILRVEARSPNDLEGSFRIRFDGAFAPFMGEAREPEPINVLPPTTAAGGKTRRVTATGARIDEPVVETAAKTPETEAAPTTATETPITENPPEATQPTASETTEATTRPTARPTRTRRPRRPATRTARNRPTPRATTEQPPAQPEQPTASTEPTTQPEPAPLGPRLIIETKDGLRVERYMTTVRRVTVDNGQIIVVLKSGKIERQPMANVQKMSIEP